MARKLTLSAQDKQHLKNLLRQAQTLRDIFGTASDKAVAIGAATGFCDPNGEFRFDKFPAVKERVQKLFQGLHEQLTTTITEGNRREWLLSEAKNNAMVEKLCKRAGISTDRAKEWLQPNMDALEAFQGRKERGMGLSDRVWRLIDQFKGELEMALELGLGDGKSATDLSRDVREYLNEPHKLFRRVRNEKGQLRLSKSAAAYNPGQGVYRSSYKNALRLTTTENNMAYRTADHERWQQLDFVIGIEILLSNNHPCEDICDELAGVYPKTFKFVGWHPFCRCIAVPKLADEDEFIERQQALIDGKDVPEEGYSGEVTECPEAFNNWVQNNAERIENAANVPYFIRDNPGAVERALPPQAATEGAGQYSYPRWKMKASDVTERGFADFRTNGFTAEDYNNSPMSGINLPLLDKRISTIFEAAGVEVGHRYLGVNEHGAMITWILAKGKGEMTRFFKREADGSVTVEHSYFQLPKQYQGKGLSKSLFRELYEHYMGVGVSKIEVHANIDRGGYTWAKYGFYANDAEEAYEALAEAWMRGHKSLNAAYKLLDDFYKINPRTEPFPMHKIAALPDGIGLLYEADWCGFVDLRNAEQRTIFEAYIGL